MKSLYPTFDISEGSFKHFDPSPFANCNFIIMSYERPVYKTSLSAQEGLSLLSENLSKDALMEPAEGVYKGIKESCVIIWNPSEEDKSLAIDVAEKLGQEFIILDMGFYNIKEKVLNVCKYMALSPSPFKDDCVFYKDTYMRLLL